MGKLIYPKFNRDKTWPRFWVNKKLGNNLRKDVCVYRPRNNCVRKCEDVSLTDETQGNDDFVLATSNSPSIIDILRL